MAFVESLPSNSSSDGNTACTTTAANSLTDNGTFSNVLRSGSGLALGQCYDGSIATYNWADINISGAEISGVRFTVDVAANVDTLSTAMQYQISIDGGSSFTSLAALDLTGVPIPNTGTTAERSTTTSETELYGLDWSGLSQADIVSGNQVIFRWYINDAESADKSIESDYTKMGVYSVVPPLPKSLSINGSLTLNGKLTIK